jgi:ABC-type transport system substrate-binding protein
LIEPSVVKYQYDPRDAARLIQSLSYTKRADGFYYDGSGQKLAVTIYTTVQNDIHPKATAAVSDYWRQLGVDVDQVMIPVQRARDREYRAQFPTFELVETGNSLRSEDVARFQSSRAPLPENHFSRAGNNSRYQNPELDALIDKYVSTVPLLDRMQTLAEIVHHQTANLTQFVLFYGLDPTLVSNRITGVQARGDQWTQVWNVQDWDIRS